MFKIGEFSKLTKVSVKTLRYYDEQGLLLPADVDRYTGYRYYAAAQLPRLHRILALKDMAFTLPEITCLLADDLGAEDLRGMLKAKRAELEAQTRDAAARLARVEARLTLIEKENEMTAYDVVTKKVDALRIAAVREIIPSYPEQGHLWKELEQYLGHHGVKPVGPCFTHYHDDCYKEKDVDAEVCEPIGAAKLPASERVNVRELPATAVASTIHKGPYDGLSGAYQALMNWIEANGYRISGVGREIYLASYFSTKDPSEFVTELQVPVTKV